MAGRQVRDESGYILEATFSTGARDGRLLVWLESRGGAIGGVNERNRDYERGFRLILTRLAALDARLLDAVVDSSRADQLPYREKVLDAGAPFPVRLCAYDAETVRRRLQASQRTVGHRASGIGKGNNTRRIRLTLEIPGDHLDTQRIEDDLARGVLVDGPAFERIRKVPGQGYSGDAKSRKAIEDRAMALTLQHLQGRDWSVEDVHLNESYDYLATKNGEEMHVEVKGLVGSLQEVFITINERRHAERWPKTALAIVTDIKVDRSGEDVTAGGGTLDFIDPWRIEDGDLEPTQFKWRRRQPG